MILEQTFDAKVKIKSYFYKQKDLDNKDLQLRILRSIEESINGKSIQSEVKHGKDHIVSTARVIIKNGNKRL